MRVEQVYWYCLIQCAVPFTKKKDNAKRKEARSRAYRTTLPLHHKSNRSMHCRVSRICRISESHPEREGPANIGKRKKRKEKKAKAASVTPYRQPCHALPSILSPPFGQAPPPRSGFAWRCSVQKGLVMHGIQGLGSELFGLFGAMSAPSRRSDGTWERPEGI